MKRFLNKYSFINLLFIFVFCYILIAFISQTTGKYIKLYQVKYAELDTSKKFEAIILRNENIIKSKNNGYIFFYNTTDNKIKTNDILYILDSVGNFSNEVKNKFSDIKKLLQEQKISIESKFDELLINNDYGNINNINSVIHTINDNIKNNINQEELIKFINEYKKNTGEIEIVYSDKIGVFSNNIDGYENININDIQNSIYPNNKNSTILLNNNTYIKQDDIIGKMVTSEEWSIVFQIDKTLKETIQDNQNINVKIESDDTILSGKIKIIEQNEHFYAQVIFNNDMIRYINKRFLNISILNDIIKGYSIPKTSVVTLNNELGVYVANTGIAKFKKISILADLDNNYIIDYNSNIKEYDMLIEDASNVIDGERVYK